MRSRIGLPRPAQGQTSPQSLRRPSIQPRSSSKRATAAAATRSSSKRSRPSSVARFAAKPALRDFVAAYAKAWAKGGPLEKRGLVPLTGAGSETAAKQATELKPLDAASLK